MPLKSQEHTLKSQERKKSPLKGQESNYEPRERLYERAKNLPKAQEEKRCYQTQRAYQGAKNM